MFTQVQFLLTFCFYRIIINGHKFAYLWNSDFHWIHENWYLQILNETTVFGVNVVTTHDVRNSSRLNWLSSTIYHTWITLYDKRGGSIFVHENVYKRNLKKLFSRHLFDTYFSYITWFWDKYHKKCSQSTCKSKIKNKR